MYNKKRVCFLLFSTLLLLTLIPNTFALLEGLYSYFYSPTDLVSLYELWHTWVDFIVFFFIIASVSRLVFGKIYGKEGEEEHPGLKGLYVGMGLFGSLGLVLFGRYSGSWQNGILVSFGPVWFIFLLLLAIITIYRLVKGEENKEPFTIGTIIFFLLLALLIGNLIYPNVFAPLLNYILGNPIFALILFFLFLLGALSLLAQFGGLGKKFLGWLGSKKRKDEEGGPSKDVYEKQRPTQQPTPEIPQPGKISVQIITSPKSPYRIGQQITIAAVIKEKKGWFGKKDAIGDFVCNWWINNIRLNEYNQIINYTIPQDIISQVEQKVNITVEVIDTENQNRTARTADYIIVRSSIPSLTITKPVNTQSGQRNLRKNVNETLEFEYAISESHPQGIDNARWLYFEGLINKLVVDNSILKKSTAFQEGNNLKQTIDQVPLNLQAGKVYTIICVALSNKKPYEIPGLKKLLADYFTLEILQSQQPTPSPTPTERSFISIQKPTTRETSKKNPLIVNYNVETKFKIGLKSKDMTEIRWSLQANHKKQASTDTIRDLGKGIETAFTFKDKMPNFLPEGEYTLFALGYSNNTLVAMDYIWINLVNIKKPQPQIVNFLLVVYDKDKKIVIDDKGKKMVHSSNFELKCKVGELFYFKGISKDVDIKDIDVEIEYDSVEDIFDNKYKTQKAAILELKTTGVKNIMCTFIKDTKTLATIAVKVIVEKTISPEEQIQSIWKEFMGWSKSQKFIGKSPPWLLFKKFLKEKKLTPETLNLDQKSYDDLTSKTWRQNTA